MLTNIKSESNAPFLKSPPLAYKIIFFKKKVNILVICKDSNDCLTHYQYKCIQMCYFAFSLLDTGTVIKNLQLFLAITC